MGTSDYYHAMTTEVTRVESLDEGKRLLPGIYHGKWSGHIVIVNAPTRPGVSQWQLTTKKVAPGIDAKWLGRRNERRSHGR